MNVESMHLKQGTWPDVLSPELRRQLLLDKINRAQLVLEQRARCNRQQLLAELEEKFSHERLIQP